MTHPNQLSEFSLLLLLMLLPSIRAYDSPHGTATIPPHDRAWIETRKPDIDTVLLWKFSPEGAEETIEEDELEEDLFAEGEGADEDDAELARLPGANDAVMPRLKGGVKIGKAGRCPHQITLYTAKDGCGSSFWSSSPWWSLISASNPKC